MRSIKNLIYKPALKVRRQFNTVATVSAKYYHPPAEAIKNNPASVSSVMAPSISPVMHPIRFL
jgi:hypothetical protein